MTRSASINTPTAGVFSKGHTKKKRLLCTIGCVVVVVVVVQSKKNIFRRPIKSISLEKRLASHAKSVTISRVCHCCCKNLSTNTVTISMICLCNVSFGSRKTQHPIFGSHRCSFLIVFLFFFFSSFSSFLFASFCSRGTDAKTNPRDGVLPPPFLSRKEIEKKHENRMKTA